MMSMFLDLLKSHEIELLKSVSEETFIETFAHCNTEQDMQKYLSESFSSSRLRSEFENPESEFFLVKSGNEVVGYMKINHGASQVELKGPDSLEVERLYVLKKFHGSGAGQMLLDKAFSIAKERGVKFIWLGVWENNFRAIRFYEKNGFMVFDKHIFMLGSDAQTDLMMKFECN